VERAKIDLRFFIKDSALTFSWGAVFALYSEYT